MTKRLALIIGVDQYKEGFPALPGARHDAEELYERLNGDPEFEYVMPEPLIGSQATHKAIREALSKYFWQPGNIYDLALFYFSGHGEHSDYHKEGYIAPYDMDPEHPIVFGIRMDDLVRIVSGSPHNCTIAMLDCCYSGWAAEGVRGGNDDVTEQFKTQAEAFVQTPKHGRYVLASSAKDQKSKEVCVTDESGNRHYHGALTRYLLEGLDKGNDKGLITYHDLSVYVDRALTANTAQCCTSLNSGAPAAADIPITRLNELRYSKALGPHIAEAEKRLAQRKPFFAAVSINRGLVICKSRRLSALTERCNTCLRDAQPKMEAYINDNGYEAWFPAQHLETLRRWTDDFLDCDNIVLLHDKEKKGFDLFLTLYRLSTHEIEKGEELEKAGDAYQLTLELTPKVVRVPGPTSASETSGNQKLS